MLTKLTIRNFKRLGDVEIELGNPVVFIGPNNSGKTTALQALALWHYGVTKWKERREGKEAPEKRPGVTINRKDLIALPVPIANLLWRDLHTHASERRNGEPKTQNVYIDVLVEGVSPTSAWSCGFEFYYGNEESIYCRPLRAAASDAGRMLVPPEAYQTKVAFMPAMSGLAANETRLDPGAIRVRVGEGRTAEVLRNLCYRLTEDDPADGWRSLVGQMRALFGVELERPEYLRDRGEITMAYRERDARLDLSCAGRGLHQVLLLLAYIYANEGTVLLIDEPDAHLEWLRQRQIYQVLAETSQSQNCQIIAASHSEVLLNEAADRDVVVAFVGRPHRIDDRGQQTLKSLKELGFEQYVLAEQNGWALYLEGSTDLAILRSFAQRLSHNAAPFLERPFVKYIENKPGVAENHFFGLSEAKRDLAGFVLVDRMDRAFPNAPRLRWHSWRRREIENYLCQPETLLAYAEHSARSDSPGDLFEATLSAKRRQVMEECVHEYVPPAALRDRRDRWWTDVKASDEFLNRVFERFYERLGLPNLMTKRDYNVLAAFVPLEHLDAEVTQVLDGIAEVASMAHPARSTE